MNKQRAMTCRSSFRWGIDTLLLDELRKETSAHKDSTCARLSCMRSSCGNELASLKFAENQIVSGTPRIGSPHAVLYTRLRHCHDSANSGPFFGHKTGRISSMQGMQVCKSKCLLGSTAAYGTYSAYRTNSIGRIQHGKHRAL